MDSVQQEKGGYKMDWELALLIAAGILIFGFPFIFKILVFGAVKSCKTCKHKYEQDDENSSS